MALVMNEYKLAEDILSGRMPDYNFGESMVLLAKYYKKNGLSKRDIKKRLEEYALERNGGVAGTNLATMVEYAIKQAMKYDLIVLDEIDITKTEMDKIASLKGIQARKLAFTLLCIAKYWDEVSGVAEHWINSPDTEVINSACIATSTKKQDELFKELYDAGMIDYAKRVDNLHVRVLFADNNDTAIRVKDLRNLGYQYLSWVGNRQYFACENCGIMVRKAGSDVGRPQKYCKSCAEEVNRIKTLARMRGLRNNCNSYKGV